MQIRLQTLKLLSPWNLSVCCGSLLVLFWRLGIQILPNTPCGILFEKVLWVPCLLVPPLTWFKRLKRIFLLLMSIWFVVLSTNVASVLVAYSWILWATQPTYFWAILVLCSSFRIFSQLSQTLFGLIICFFGFFFYRCYLYCLLFLLYSFPSKLFSSLKTLSFQR